MSAELDVSGPLAVVVRIAEVNLADPDVVRIDRRTAWGNPFRIGVHGDRAEVVARYREYVRGRADLMARLGELRGKRLACWCAPELCHGDVLVALLADLDRPAVVHGCAGEACRVPGCDRSTVAGGV